MARNKRPALTSPWKIGFLVSLLLVAVSIGVGYLITRSFGLSWSWIAFHGSWTDFTFNRDAFMKEMLPLAALVPAMALLAYVAITGAVRKYRRYLDSGADYRRLIQLVGKIGDLHNENEIRKLSGYPELRDFLLKIRAGVIEREKALEAREAERNTGGEDTLNSEALGREVDVLVSAVMAGPDNGFQRELALTIPELKRVETALRENMVDASAAKSDSKAQEELAALRADLGRRAESLGAELDAIRHELAQSEQNARELESEMGTLRAHANASQPAAANGDELERAVSRLDSISDVLKSLGEETRSVAINTALEATSADASGESVVKLADGVRDVAAKFNGVAEQWEEASGAARAAIASTPTAAPASPRLGESLDGLSQKLNRWVEHSVMLGGKVKTFEQQLAGAVGTSTATATATPETDVDDFAIETVSEQPVAPVEDDFDTTAASVNLELDTDAPPRPVDSSGFEKQEGLFSELATPAGESTEMFTDIPAGEAPGPVRLHNDDAIEPVAPRDIAPTSPEEHVIDQEPAPPVAEDTPAAPKEYVIDEEPAAAPREYVIDEEPDRSGVGDVINGPSSSPDVDEAVDLYALGAVDYEPENIHHNA